MMSVVKFLSGAIGAFLLACAAVAAFAGPHPSPEAGGLLFVLAVIPVLFAASKGVKSGKSVSAPSLPPMPSGRR